MTVCPSCNQQVNEDWQFCVFCRGPLAAGHPSDPATSVTFTQDLSDSTIAHRVEPKEMQGLVSKTLVVNQDQQALLFKGGRLENALTPGSHPMGNILVNRMRDTTVVLFRTGDLPLNLSIPRLLSNDPLPLAMDFRLILSVHEPTLFFLNLMAGANVYGTENLTSSLYPLVEEGCRAFTSLRSVRELGTGGGGLRELGLSLTSHLDQALTRWGLRLASCQAVNIRCEAWDDLTQTRAEYFLAASMEEADLEGRKRLFDVHQGLELQAMAEETASIVVVEKRAALWERMRQALLANAKSEIESQSELEDLIRRADRDQLLKESEHQSLAATLAEAKEDHQKAREFLLRRVESEGEYELKKLDLSHRFGLSEERLSLELASSRQEMEGQWELDLKRLDLRIERKRQLAQFQREQSDDDLEQENRRRMGDATTVAAIADIERDQDDKDVRMALAWHDQYNSQERHDIRERREAELEAERVRMEIELQAEETRLTMRLDLERQQHNNDLARIDALSKVGIETLIAVSGTEQSQILAQLARTRALSGCTPQQIMAMEAHESPQMAEALKEILTATAGGGQLDQYERLIGELKEAGRISREDNRDNLSTLTEMFGNAMDSVRDTAVAFSGAPGIRSVDSRGTASAPFPEGTVTLLFSDIVDYTAMTEKLGDERAQEMLHIHNELVRKAVGDHGGTEVKSMNGGFMVAFSSGRDGILCAISIQRALRDLDTSGADWDIQARIGLHSGVVTKEASDYSGRNVILGTRIAAKAKGGQILVSSLLKEITESEVDIRFGDECQLELKGLDGTSRLYLVDW